MESGAAEDAKMEGGATEDAKVEGDPSDEQQRKRSKTSEDSLLRWKRRRQLKNVLDEAGDFPSFVSLISAPDGGVADDGGGLKDKDLTPETIAIDVDEYLGLKKKEPHSNKTEIQPHHQPAINASTGKRSTPADEGYYEGRVLLASPDDEQYLSSIQQLIRSNLELFSATALDAAGSQAGRRQPIVEGKVGVRCIHCTKFFLEKLKSPTSTSAGSKEDAAKIWPPGSISYPTNIAGLYGICSGKPQLHFDACPNTPLAVKSHFHRHANDKGGGQSKSKEVPAALYYVVAAKRLGLIDVPGGGIRFARDLKLEPLPLEAVLASEIQENEEFKAQALPPVFSPQSGMASPEMVGSSTSVGDATAEQVLAEAVAEPEDPDKNPSRSSDRKMVSDFIFITVRQLAICRAVPADFATRGKKTKKMRLGFAGFCCRHCLRVREAVDGSELARANGASDYSCRSFSSAADNLASAITNTFALHIMKCVNVPVRIRKALAVYKRHHARQMSELPYGSQRKLFSEIWARLREADIPEDEMKDRIERFMGGDPSAATLPERVPSSVKSRSPSSSSRQSNSPKTFPKGSGRRTIEIPGSKDPETARVLERFEQDWNPSVNDGLILPPDRDITSDYLFLTVRQLRVTLPTAADVAKCKRGTAIGAIAGMCCMHCDRKDPSLIAPSSRSFATAPDNYASAFNTSLYNHMQSCIFIKPDVKRALADLRKIHSQQIQALEIGSQRRFFTLLFNRLRSVPVPGKLAPGPAAAVAKPTPVSSRSSRGSNSGAAAATAATDRRGRATRSSESADDALLSRFGFFEAPCQSFFCLRCRMVPLQFRARGSLCFARPTIDFLTEHSEACKEDGFDLWFVNESLKKLFRTDFDVKHLTDPLFKEVMMECFGRDEQLANVFTNEIVKVFQMSRHGGVSRAIEMAVKAKTQGLWFRLPQTVDTSKVTEAYAKFAASVKGMSPRLADNSALATYLLLISPSLSLKEEEEDADAEDEEAEGSEAGAKTPSEAEGSDFEDIIDDEEEEDKKPTAAQRTKRGKELRRNDGDNVEPPAEVDKDEDGGEATVPGNDDSVRNVVVAPKPRGKELRK